tara:strand:+ start:2283 stop:2699 length:417 start_codon:yes stop_codon:yes gene_type:complete
MKACVYVENKSKPSLVAIGSTLECIPSNKIDTLPSAVYNEIELIEVLEYDERPEILQLVASKIRHGGSIKIVGTDAIQVTKGVSEGSMTAADASIHLLNGRVRMNSIHEVRKMLESVGFQILFATISGNKYLLEALRP